MEGAGALSLKSLWYLLGWILIASIVYLSLTPNPPQPLEFNGVDKFEHLLAYASLMAWFSQLQLSHRQRIRNAILFVLMGIGVEILQGMGGVRQFEYSDMLANSCGVLLGWLLSAYLGNTGLRVLDKKLSRYLLQSSSIE